MKRLRLFFALVVLTACTVPVDAQEDPADTPTPTPIFQPVPTQDWQALIDTDDTAQETALADVEERLAAIEFMMEQHLLAHEQASVPDHAHALDSWDLPLHDHDEPRTFLNQDTREHQRDHQELQRLLNEHAEEKLLRGYGVPDHTHHELHDHQYDQYGLAGRHTHPNDHSHVFDWSP